MNEFDDYSEIVEKERILSFYLKNSNILKFIDFYEDTHLHLFFEYFEGEDLYEHVKTRKNRLEEYEIQNIIHQLSYGVKTLLDKKKISPHIFLENIFLSSKQKDYVVKIASFGPVIDKIMLNSSSKLSKRFFLHMHDLSYFFRKQNQMNMKEQFVLLVMELVCGRSRELENDLETKSPEEIISIIPEKYSELFKNLVFSILEKPNFIIENSWIEIIAHPFVKNIEFINSPKGEYELVLKFYKRVLKM